MMALCMSYRCCAGHYVMDNIVFRGIAISDGYAEGVVKILRDENDFWKVKYGDIIVVPRSSPAWTVPLMCAAGMICEIGGRLSHIAIICREIGVPCVSEVQNATSNLQDGDYVAIDCRCGEVRKFEHR